MARKNNIYRDFDGWFTLKDHSYAFCTSNLGDDISYYSIKIYSYNIDELKFYERTV